MENKAHALIAGLFTVVLLLAAIFGVMWFNGDRVQRVPYEIATKLSVPGLNPQADVRYRGLNVGRVDTIVFDPQSPGQILIRLKINLDTPMTPATYGTLGYQGVTGIAYIQLDDDGSNPAKLASSASKPARITLRGFIQKTKLVTQTCWHWSSFRTTATRAGSRTSPPPRSSACSALRLAPKKTATPASSPLLQTSGCRRSTKG